MEKALQKEIIKENIHLHSTATATLIWKANISFKYIIIINGFIFKHPAYNNGYLYSLRANNISYICYYRLRYFHKFSTWKLNFVFYFCWKIEYGIWNISLNAIYILNCVFQLYVNFIYSNICIQSLFSLLLWWNGILYSLCSQFSYESFVVHTHNMKHSVTFKLILRKVCENNFFFVFCFSIFIPITAVSIGSMVAEKRKIQLDKGKKNILEKA